MVSPRLTSLRIRCESFILALGMVVLFAAAPAVAQKEAAGANDEADDANSLAGKITAVEQKGRTVVLTVEAENGETSEHILSSRIPVKVMGKGDSGFLRPGMVVSTEAAKSNKMLFGKDFTVYLDGSRNRGWKEGKTKEIVQLIGPIIKIDEKEMTLNLGRTTGLVQLEKDYKVEVETANRDLIVAGATVEMQGKPSRGKFRPTYVEIHLAKTLDSQKYFEGKKSPAKRSRSRRGTKSDDKEEDSAKNPFAEIDKGLKKSEGDD